MRTHTHIYSLVLAMKRSPDYENTLQYSLPVVILVFLCLDL